MEITKEFVQNMGIEFLPKDIKIRLDSESLSNSDELDLAIDLERFGTAFRFIANKVFEEWNLSSTFASFICVDAECTVDCVSGIMLYSNINSDIVTKQNILFRFAYYHETGLCNLQKFEKTAELEESANKYLDNLDKELAPVKPYDFDSFIKIYQETKQGE